ncbi:HAMP domain-containing sensor histidine kinase [Massilibacteroides sp.]|uniref:sensor histidine kinase n=1 Tax=Massilibacteroides sp. TaxID=2034766 RepID=UPI0026229CA9|nr:HAMP domain-containing sensor histidine kinase [Massilibacteroides sp.]MDD4515162.1 HAMP domain-containing sensor histidine kinase [Massilibacteroides sp.]
MNRTNVYFAGGVIIVLLLALFGAYMVVSGISYTLAALSLLGILYTGFLLYKRFTKNNERIFRFLCSLKNADPSVIIPPEEAELHEQQFCHELKDIADIVRDHRQRYEEQTTYYEGIMNVMTHELRNGLTPISSLSSYQLSENKESNNSELIEDLELIHSQSKLLQSCLEAYHKLMYMPEPVKETVALDLLFQKVERMIQGEKNSNKVVFELNADWSVLADSGLLTLAILHVIRNGIQAVESIDNGVVTVRITNDKPYSVDIEDNGKGIPENLQSSVFSPFFSTKNTGSGIGLSIAHRIMQLHGGKLVFTSLPGKTIFTFQFRYS